tara:strand:- start:404 stop:754 length:351 start_codon:yes stop_codon:yes gene_type:complete
MKLSDTIIGSIIIGVLVGGAILLTGGGGQEGKHAQIKILKSPHENMGSQEFLHKEIIINKDSDSEMKLNFKSDDITQDLPADIAATVEKALSEALGAMPEDVDINIVIKTDKKVKK